MKTYLYLASGRPIVAPDLPDLGEILEDGKNAVLVAPDDVDACAAALTKLISDPHESDRLGSQARDDANLYTWEKRGGRIAEFLRARMGAPV
jgi:glycosyltransferase involved in cell wall biosynthesis